MELADGFEPTIYTSFAEKPLEPLGYANMAGVVGIEPTSGGLESLILPLNYTPTLNFNCVHHRCRMSYPLFIFKNWLREKDSNFH